jgi:flagellin
MRINTNVAGLQAQEANKNTNTALATSLERLSTGLKINKAADDASGLAIADKLRTQATSIGQGLANASSASALIQIADKAMSEQSNILDTVKAKLIQAATDTTTDDGRESIRKDITKLLDQFDSIAQTTNYNGTTLLQASDSSTAARATLTFQIGEESNYDITLSPSNAVNTLHLGGGDTAITTADSGESVGLVNDGGGDIVLEVSATATFTLSGVLGKISGGSDDVKLTATDAALINMLDAMVAADSGGAEISGANGTYWLLAEAEIDFGSFNVNGLTVTTKQEEAITVEGSTTGTINLTNDTLTERILITNADGGALLNNIKTLAVDGLTSTAANNFMDTIDNALTQLNAIRADFGSSQNQIQSSIRNLQTTQTNLLAAESVIRDVDYAAESSTFNKQNIIAQAGTYAMSQANAVSQNVLRLLQ